MAEAREGRVQVDDAVKLLATSRDALRRAERWGYIPKPTKAGYPATALVNGFSRYLQAGEMTLKEAGDLIGTSDEWVRKLIADGYVEKNERGNVLRADVVRGRIRQLQSEERRSSKVQTESRVRDARAEEIELRISERRRELVPRAEAEAAMDLVVAKVRGEFAGLPASLTRDLSLRRKIETAVHGTLIRIADELATARAALEAGGVDASPEPEDDA